MGAAVFPEVEWISSFCIISRVSHIYKKKLLEVLRRLQVLVSGCNKC